MNWKPHETSISMAILHAFGDIMGDHGYQIYRATSSQIHGQLLIHETPGGLSWSAWKLDTQQIGCFGWFLLYVFPQIAMVRPYPHFFENPKSGGGFFSGGFPEALSCWDPKNWPRLTSAKPWTWETKSCKEPAKIRAKHSRSPASMSPNMSKHL